MKQPIVSIIIPVFNREKLIVKALDSVIAQLYTNWECLVVDDGSTDGTLEILKGYSAKDSRISFSTRQREPKGAPTCRNIGLENANGDYVIYLDSDDYLLPFCLEQRITVFKEHNACAFLVFPMGEQGEELIIKKEIPKSKDYLVNFLLAVMPWQTMCPIWKTSFLNHLGGFTEGYPRFNDPELMIRALLQPQVKYEVFHEANYDSVFLPSVKQSKIFKDKVYQSLMLFIPDVVKYLEHQGKSSYKPYLALYLHLWFKYFYVPAGKWDVKQSVKLISMFRRYRIIGIYKTMNLYFRLLLYAISIIILNNPINKLTDKSLYFT